MFDEGPGWEEVVDVLFPVETARTAVQSRVQSVEMIGSCEDQKAIIALDTIELVQEERPIPIVDQTVHVLEDQNARR